MKDYMPTESVFSESIPIVEEDDLVNAENNNAAPKQLLQNILALRAIMVMKEEGKSLVSDAERNLWNMIYEQATGYTDQKIADLINGAPSTLDTLGEIAAAMGENVDVVEALEFAIGTKANQIEMESLLGTKLDKTGDAQNNTITYSSSDTSNPSSWAEIALFKTGEKISTFANKVSTMMKNVRFLWKLCGNNDISALGDGTITGAINALNTGLAGKASSDHTHGHMGTWEWMGHGQPAYLWGSNEPGAGFIVSPSQLTVQCANHIGSYNVDNILHSGKYAVMHSGIMEGWSIVTENGQEFVSYITGCYQFVSPQFINLYFDILLRDGFGDTSRTAHAHMFNIDAICASLGLSTLSWDYSQSTAQFFLGEAGINSIKGNTMENILKLLNQGGLWTGNFSGFRSKSNGRVSRFYYDGNIRPDGHMPVCGTGVQACMMAGTIWRIQVIGASYT